MNEFLKDWIQYLQKQKEIYGKIEDKYPAHLKSSLKRQIERYIRKNMSKLDVTKNDAGMQLYH